MENSKSEKAIKLAGAALEKLQGPDRAHIHYIKFLEKNSDNQKDNDQAFELARVALEKMENPENAFTYYIKFLEKNQDNDKVIELARAALEKMEYRQKDLSKQFNSLLVNNSNCDKALDLVRNIRSKSPSVHSENSFVSKISINTDQSDKTDEIRTNHTIHSFKRMISRKISKKLIQKCLKYGKKSRACDNKIKYKLRDLVVFKTDKHQSSKILTVQKIFTGKENEILIGYVNSYSMKKGQGFISTTKGGIYFKIKNLSEINKMVNKVVKFRVGKCKTGLIADDIEIIAH